LLGSNNRIRHRLELRDHVQMLIERGEAHAHRVDAHMCRAQIAPRGDLRCPLIGGGQPRTNAHVDAKRRRIAAFLAQIAVQLLDHHAALIQRHGVGHPAITQPRHAPQHSIRPTAKPHRDRALDGHRIQPGIADRVEFTGKRDQRIGPQPFEQRDLLRAAPPARVEVLAQRLVFDRVPADAHTQPHPPPGQHIERRGLLGDQRGLALGQHQDTGHKFKAIRDRRQMAEQHKHLVEQALVRIGAAPPAGAIRIRAQHMIVGQHVVIAQRFHLPGIGPHISGIGADLGLGKDNAQFHHSCSLYGNRSIQCCRTLPPPVYPGRKSRRHLCNLYD
jgi:hypothetical protein